MDQRRCSRIEVIRSSKNAGGKDSEVAQAEPRRYAAKDLRAWRVIGFARIAVIAPISPRSIRLIRFSISDAADLLWEGQPRPGSDTTDAFRVAANEAGFEIRTVLTIKPAV
jgi:hypothetical protein